MTASPNAQPQVFENVDDAVRWLRARGLRLSTARRLLLEALFAAEGPISAARLARTLSLEESSVYRNLELLEYRGLVRHIHLGHSPGLYVLARDHELEYLYCERCAKVTAVAPDRLDAVRERIQGEFGYAPSFTHFALVGICNECAAAPEGPGSNEDREMVGSTPASHRHEPRGTDTEPGSAGHEHLHSHGDYIHSHPHVHPGRKRAR